VLEEEAVLLEDTEGFQITGSKYKKVVARDEEGQRPSKKSNKGSTIGALQSRWRVLTVTNLRP